MLRRIIQAGSTIGSRPTPASDDQSAPRRGLGDMVERLVKPIAQTLQRAGMVNCLDERNNLRPESKCAKRKSRLNKLGKKLGL